MGAFFMKKHFVVALIGLLALFRASPSFALTVTEGQFFWVLGIITVKYGVPGKYIDVVFTPGNGTYQSCSASSDPAPGVVKHCIVPPQDCNSEQQASLPQGACTDANPADKVCASLGDLGTSSSKWLYKGSGLSTCRGDCVFIPESSGYDKVTGYTIAWGKLINQGISCGTTSQNEPVGYSDADQDKPADAPHAGEKGYCPGQVNGVTVWVKCSVTTDSTSSKSTDSTTNTPASGGVGTSSSSSTGVDSRTTCDGSNCTTTSKQTTVNADGSKTEKETTSTVPQSDYCKSNPNAVACKSSSWSGDCAAGFSGDGDAVQVATARAVWEAKCEIGKRDSDAENKFNEIKSDSLASLVVGDRTITPPTKPVSTCAITDMTVQVGDFAVPFNLSGICQYLALIQKVITAFGSLMWLMIVFRGN